MEEQKFKRITMGYTEFKEKLGIKGRIKYIDTFSQEVIIELYIDED